MTGRAKVADTTPHHYTSMYVLYIYIYIYTSRLSHTRGRIDRRSSAAGSRKHLFSVVEVKGVVRSYNTYRDLEVHV